MNTDLSPELRQWVLELEPLERVAIAAKILMLTMPTRENIRRFVEQLVPEAREEMACALDNLYF